MSRNLTETLLQALEAGPASGRSVARTCRLPETTVRRALDVLVDAGLVEKNGENRTSVYELRHDRATAPDDRAISGAEDGSSTAPNHCATAPSGGAQTTQDKDLTAPATAPFEGGRGESTNVQGLRVSLDEVSSPLPSTAPLDRATAPECDLCADLAERVVELELGFRRVARKLDQILAGKKIICSDAPELTESMISDSKTAAIEKVRGEMAAGKEVDDWGAYVGWYHDRYLGKMLAGDRTEVDLLLGDIAWREALPALEAKVKAAVVAENDAVEAANVVRRAIFRWECDHRHDRATPEKFKDHPDRVAMGKKLEGLAWDAELARRAIVAARQATYRENFRRSTPIPENAVKVSA